MKGDFITVTLTEYREETHDYKAIHNGEEVRVDPYVGCVWRNELKKLGEFKFRGHWHRGCYLVSEELY